MMTYNWWARSSLVVCVLVVLSVAVTACGSGSSSSNSSTSGGEAEGSANSSTVSTESGSSGGTFTAGLADDTPSLDPANCPTTIYCRPAYNALIQMGSKGEFEPSLATSWKFTDAGHQSFEVKLREGLKFSDGTELTGAAAAASMISFSKVPSVSTTNYFPIRTVKAAGKYAFIIEYKEPVTYRYACEQISSNGTLGRLVGPEGVKDRKSLEKSSDGIGPYVLDSSETTKGSTYTWVPNPDYYEKSGIKFGKVVFKVMPEPASRFSAVQSGQIDWAQQILNEDRSQAESAGLQITQGEPGSQPMVILANRESGPLSKLEVREALSYALPREELAVALYGEEATPSSALVFEHTEGFDAEAAELFPYNVEKAKELLAKAGYANGFTLKLLSAGIFDPNNSLSQAMQASLGEIGVKVEIEPVAQLTTYTEKAASKQYDAMIQNSGAVGLSSLLLVKMGPGSPGNPWSLPIPAEVTKLAKEAALEPTPEAQEEKMEEASLAFSKQVWTLTVAEQPVIQAVSSKVGNVAPSYLAIQPDPFGEEWTLSG